MGLYDTQSTTQTYADTNNQDEIYDRTVYQLTLSTNDFLEELENDLRGRVRDPKNNRYVVMEDQRLMSDKACRMFLQFIKPYFKHHHALANMDKPQAAKRVIAFSKTVTLWFFKNKAVLDEQDYNNRTEVKRAVEDMYHSLLTRSVGARENTNVYGHETLQKVQHQVREERKLLSKGFGLFGKNQGEQQ